MTLSQISLNGARSYGLYSASLHPTTTLILGRNGTGKTTLLEAMYVLYRGTSFRGRDRDIVTHGLNKAEMKVTFDDGTDRRMTLEIQSDGKFAKRFIIDGGQSARLPSKHKLPIVLFEPDELRLLTSSPQRRRDFIDGIIERLSPTYGTVLSRFARTLAQRNELLKQYEPHSAEAWEAQLFAWDVKLAELSATIIKTRTNFIAKSNARLTDFYQKMSGDMSSIKARYLTQFSRVEESMLTQAMLNQLQMSKQTDALRGFTSYGPHRDDIELRLNGYLAPETASRGEMRTIMLAFKLLEVELQTIHSGQNPLILLDDVFSELDTEREKHLLDVLKPYQTIITATDLRDELKVHATIISL